MSNQTLSKNLLIFFVIIVTLLALMIFSMIPKRTTAPGTVTSNQNLDTKSQILSVANTGRHLTDEERQMVYEYLGDNPAPVWSKFTMEEKSAIIGALNKK